MTHFQPTSSLGVHFQPQTYSPYALKIGSSAPDFTLKTKTATGLEDVTLSKNFGQKATVLLFFPLAFTSVCTTEMCDKTAAWPPSAVSTPRSTASASTARSRRRPGPSGTAISATLLSDLDKKVIKAYDVVFPLLAGVGDTAARAVFVIDKAGKIVYAEQTPTPKDLPDFAAVKAALAKL